MGVLLVHKRTNENDLLDVITDHVRSTREGNVFTSVCDYVRRGYVLSRSCLGKGMSCSGPAQGEGIPRPGDPSPLLQLGLVLPSMGKRRGRGTPTS